MSAKRVYAEDTSVPAYRSQNEVREMLRAIGADRFAIMEVEGRVAMRFAVNGTLYQIERPAPPEIKGATADQKERAAWRALVLLVKAKKVAIEQNITTVEREFMADTVLPNGARLIDYREQIIEHAYSEGPPRLGFES